MRTANLLLFSATMISITGCGPDFRQLRQEGQRAYSQGNYAIAQDCFEQAYHLSPEDARNLYDMGMVAMTFGEQQLDRGNKVAAMRDLDRAIDYFSRAIRSHPGMQCAWVAKNEALEMKGRTDEALREAERAMSFVGPSARQHLFVARELEERGDLDGALLKYRQAVAMEPDNATAHSEFGAFLRRIGKNEMAIVHYSRAYRLNPVEPGVARALTELGSPLPRTTEPYAP